MLCMYGNRGEPRRPACQPTTGNLFMFPLLPSSCQEAPQRGTADYSVLLATPSCLEWLGFSAYSIGWCFVATLKSREVSSSISALTHTHSILQALTLLLPALRASDFIKQVLTESYICDPKQINTNLLKTQCIK